MRRSFRSRRQERLARVEGRERLRAHFAAITETPLKHTAFENITVYQTSDPEVIIAEHDAVRAGHQHRAAPTGPATCRSSESVTGRPCCGSTTGTRWPPPNCSAWLPDLLASYSTDEH